MAEPVNDAHPTQPAALIAVRRKWPSRRWLLLLIAVVLIVVLPASLVVGHKIKDRPSTLAVAFSPDGHLLASGSTHTVKLWNVNSGSQLRTFSN